MADIQKEIVDWLKALKGWQTELAYRILTKAEITNDDILAIFSMVKSNTAFTEKEFPNFVSIVESALPIRLKAIEAISNIESLAPRNPLKFDASKNLIVIYGLNGTGKSGYTKIIKKATGKPRASQLKANVFNNSGQPSKCTFKYAVDGVEHSTEWHIDDAAIDDLSQIDVFDTKTGEGYLKEANTVTHTPTCISLFEALSKYYNIIGQKLNNEKALLIKDLPAIPSNIISTRSAIAYNSLKKSSTKTTLASILVWEEKDETAKKAIEDRLKEKDPAKVASEKRTFRSELDKIVNELKGALKLISEDSIIEISGLRTGAIDKRKIARDGAQILTGKSEIQGVGSLVWRSLWEAAKNYSLQEAYKGNAYPNIEVQSRCVLCHQLLDEEAKERLSSFDRYVNGALEAEAALAEKVYTDKIKALPVVLSKEIITLKCRASNLDSDWIEKIARLWEYIANGSEAIKKNETNIDDYKERANVIIAELESISALYGKIIIQLDTDAKLFDRVQAEKDLLELTAKKWCSEQEVKILAEIQRLKTIAQYDDLLSQATTNAITIQTNKVSKVLITDKYIKRFNEELVFLGANNIKVEIIKEGGGKGSVKHLIKLKDVENVKPADILSEGEHRIITLAAFLADVTGGNNSNTFVFDDPISSLDQSYEEKIVKRLVELSQTRQVIVFTHRLSLLGQLNAKCESDKIQIIGIRHENWGAGEIGDTQLFAKKTDKALNSIKNDKISKAKRIYKEQGYDEYYPHGKMLCSDIRIVVERIVECDFLADVVQRYRREVNTKGKIDNLVKIKKEDCLLINDYMTRYSYYEHSQPGETPVEIPEPSIIEADVDNLLAWLNEYNTRKLD